MTTTLHRISAWLVRNHATRTRRSNTRTAHYDRAAVTTKRPR